MGTAMEHFGTYQSEENRRSEEAMQEACNKFILDFEKVAKKLETLGSEMIDISKDKSDLTDLSKTGEKTKAPKPAKEEQKVETKFDKKNKTAETKKESVESKLLVDSWNKEFDSIINSLKGSLQTVKDEKVSQNYASDPKKNFD